MWGNFVLVKFPRILDFSEMGFTMDQAQKTNFCMPLHWLRVLQIHWDNHRGHFAFRIQEPSSHIKQCSWLRLSMFSWRKTNTVVECRWKALPLYSSRHWRQLIKNHTELINVSHQCSCSNVKKSPYFSNLSGAEQNQLNSEAAKCI